MQIMNRLLPVIARLRSRCLGSRPIFDCASEIVELSPAIEREQLGAISLPSEFDRVVGLQEETTLEMELDRLRPGKRRHGATMAYRLDHATIAQGTLYFKGGHDVIRRGSAVLLPRQKNCFAEMQLCTNNVIERYFGHWLIEGLALELLAKQTSVQGLVLGRRPWMHEAGYRKLCGIESVQTDNAFIDRLWIVDDRGLNANWISRVKELRRRIREGLRSTSAKRIFLTRGTQGVPRNLVNSDELHDVLGKWGFMIVNPESESAQGLANAISAAKLVIVVEGSVQNHCIHALPVGSTLLTIQPPTRFNANSKDRADAVGLNWGFVVADPHPDGFHLPIDRLMRTIDEVSRVIAQRAVA
jgi:Glycosyltransferase 61